MVVDVSVALHELRGKVDGVAAKEEVICGGDGEGVAHEGTGVEGEGGGHGTGDAVHPLAPYRRKRGERREEVHLRILAHVCDGGKRDTEVARRAPEICSQCR